MELGAILLLLGVLVIVVLFVAQPFTEQWHAKMQSGHETSVLLAKRENALNALQELDFDFKLGKIPAEEYSVQRASLLQMGAANWGRGLSSGGCEGRARVTADSSAKLRNDKQFGNGLLTTQ